MRQIIGVKMRIANSAVNKEDHRAGMTVVKGEAGNCPGLFTFSDLLLVVHLEAMDDQLQRVDTTQNSSSSKLQKN